MYPEPHFGQVSFGMASHYTHTRRDAIHLYPLGLGRRVLPRGLLRYARQLIPYQEHRELRIDLRRVDELDERPQVRQLAVLDAAERAGMHAAGLTCLPERPSPSPALDQLSEGLRLQSTALETPSTNDFAPFTDPWPALPLRRRLLYSIRGDSTLTFSKRIITARLHSVS